jgi:hypothetical protein
MRDRGRRIETKARILKQRVRRGRLNLLGMEKKFEREPHRLVKVKVKFTSQHGSMKEDKQLANRAARSRARDAIKRDVEPPAEPKNSVRWDYW